MLENKEVVLSALWTVFFSRCSESSVGVGDLSFAQNAPGVWVVRAAKCQEAAPKLLLFSKQNICDWTALRMTYKLKKKQTKPTRITKKPSKLWHFYSFHSKHSANGQHL